MTAAAGLGIAGAILRSRPVPVAPAAPVEVHTLLRSGDLPLYLMAAKSLLRHWPAPSLVVHDDGTLGAADAALLGDHLPGVRVHARTDADRFMAERLAPWPALRGLRAAGPRLLQLTDYFGLAEADLVVSMDADVLVRGEPRRLLDWAAAGGCAGGCLLYSPEYGWTPMGVHWIPEVHPGRPFLPDLCCGFAAARRSCFWDPALLAELVEATPEEIVAGGRYVSQMCYSLLGGALGPPHVVGSLGDGYRSGRVEHIGAAPRVVYHYFGSHERDTAEESLVGEEPLFREALEGLA